MFKPLHADTNRVVSDNLKNNFKNTENLEKYLTEGRSKCVNHVNDQFFLTLFEARPTFNEQNEEKFTLIFKLVFEILALHHFRSR